MNLNNGLPSFYMMNAAPKASLEKRVARIEGILSQMDKRLNHLETEVAKLSDKMDRNFRWTIGILLGVLIPMWTTIILTQPCMDMKNC